MSGPAQNSEKRRIFVPHQATWRGRAIARLVWLMVKTVSATMRYHAMDDAGVIETGKLTGPVIFCIWHNRLALCLELYRLFILQKQPQRRLAALVSASRDGAVLARILELFGVQPVRGSANRRGPQSLLELTTWAEQGYDLAITPDGSKGPRYELKEGVVMLAQVTGLPIVPVSYNLSWKVALNTWDRFQIPLPFSVCTVVLAPPVFVPRTATDEQRQKIRQEIENKMRAITVD